MDVFERQDAAYRQHVVPWHLPRVAIEAGSTGLWWKFVGEHGDVVGIDRFGESAPGGALFELFGITAEAVAKRALAVLANDAVFTPRLALAAQAMSA
jgi:transketolase